MNEKDSLLSIPKYDGDYEYWAMLMENLLQSKEWWHLVETGFTKPAKGTTLNEAQIKLLDLKVKSYLFAGIEKSILKTMLQKNTAKELWDSMKHMY